MKRRLICLLTVTMLATSIVGCATKEVTSVDTKNTIVTTTKKETETTTQKEIDNTKEAKALYESNKADWSCNEDTFVKAYNKYINKGLTAEQVKEQLTVEYSKSYKEEQETVKKEENKQEPQKEETKKEETTTHTEKVEQTKNDMYRSLPVGWTQKGEHSVWGKVWYYVTQDRTVYMVYEFDKANFDTNNIKQSVADRHGFEVYREVPEEPTKNNPTKENNKKQETHKQETTNKDDAQLHDPTKLIVGEGGGYDPNK